MSCDKIQRELVAYQFGVIENTTRCEVEVHLASCPACLESFLALKRDVETAESGPQPSPAVRERLRASVARELGLRQPRHWSWWERPLAFGFAGVTVLLALIAVSVLATGPGVMPRGLVDAPVTSSTPAP